MELLTSGLWATRDEFGNVVEIKTVNDKRSRGKASSYLMEYMAPHTIELAWGDYSEDEYIFAKVVRVYEWTVRFRVAAMWVQDGFDLDDDRAMRMLQKTLPYAYSGELEAEVTDCPERASIRKEQGYND